MVFIRKNKNGVSYLTQMQVDATCQNVSWLLLRLKSRLEKDAISAGSK